MYFIDTLLINNDSFKNKVDVKRNVTYFVTWTSVALNKNHFANKLNVK